MPTFTSNNLTDPLRSAARRGGCGHPRAPSGFAAYRSGRTKGDAQTRSGPLVHAAVLFRQRGGWAVSLDRAIFHWCWVWRLCARFVRAPRTTRPHGRHHGVQHDPRVNVGDDEGVDAVERLTMATGGGGRQFAHDHPNRATTD